MPRNPASFRDPAGYVFKKGGKVYRAINASYFSVFEHLHTCGLYDKLVQANFLIPHTLISESKKRIVIKPQRIPFISYPCEWSFSMLKQAALLHLRINMLALEYNLLLKDASAYNVQFIGSQAVFIDTLSFAYYLEDKPWYAFGQFCRHFVAPLLLMKYKALDTNRWLTSTINGIQLDLAARLLPLHTRLSPFIQSTVHHHVVAIDKNKTKNAKHSKKMLCKLFTYLLTNLADIKLTDWQAAWQDYYSNTNYPPALFAEKKQVVTQWLKDIKAQRIFDIGGNDGFFSRDSVTQEGYVITSNNDPLAVEQTWQHNKQKTNNILPLLLDITNPTPAFGPANTERVSFLQRIKTAKIDCSLVLALLHRLCITYNCRFNMLAQLFASCTCYLIIEFVDRQDSCAAQLLANMRDNYHVFDFYRKENFIAEFEQVFEFVHIHKLSGMHRTLYLMRVRG